MILKRIKKQFYRVFQLFVLTFLTLSLVNCAPKNQGNEVILSWIEDPKTFNAVLSAQYPSVFSYIYEGLVIENPITGKKEPALAESWQISEDKLTIIFTLRDNLKWSDGEPLTTDDVVFTYNDLYLNPKIPNNSRDGLLIGEKRIPPTITKLDERRVQFEIAEPYAPFLNSAGLNILPAHILRPYIEENDQEGNPKFLSVWGTDTSPSEIVSNGPYRLKEYVTSQRVVFEKNPYYWRKDKEGNSLPYIDKVIVAIVENTDTSLLQFRSGSLDSFGVAPAYYSLLKQEEERGNFTIYNGGPAYGVVFISFNLNKGKRNGKPLVDPIKSQWFNNVNFRRAIAHGINRPRIVNNIYRGLGEPQITQISVQSPYYNQSIQGYEFNPEKAKELLLKEGFEYNNQGELLDSKGNPVEFSLITNAGNKIREAMGAQIQEDLGNIGIKVNFTPIAFNVLVDKLSNSLDWDAHMIGFTGGNEPHSPNIWYTDGHLHSFNQKAIQGEPLEGRVIADWEQEIQQLYIDGVKEYDIEKRKPYYDKAQQLVSEYLPYIYLVNPYSLQAVRNCFDPIEYSALGGAFWNLEQIKNTCDSPS
ncbi:MAG: ABC transporter substrate-binding protein [Microcystaceae cyanobacterium]